MITDQQSNANDCPAPDEKTFWQTYSPQYEFPISIVGAIFLLTFLFAMTAVIPYLFVTFHRIPDRTPVPMVGIQGGVEDGDEGGSGGGGVPEPEPIAQTAPSEQDFAALPDRESIPEVQKEIQKRIAIDDPNGAVTVSPEKAAGLATLEKSLRDKLAGIGGKKGTPGGPTAGPGTGTGAAGNGANGTRARSLRWVLRFRTADGRDYLNQLSAVGATILVPLPPENKKAYIFRDLNYPKPGELVSEEEWNKLEEQIRFCDFKRDSVSGMASALKLDFTPHSFWAFFPKHFEDELSLKETAYSGRKAEDIEETIFEVVIRGGRSVISVASQRPKR